MTSSDRIHNQASVLPVLKKVREQLPYFAFGPNSQQQVLVPAEVDSRTLSSFSLRNFGASVQFALMCRNNQVPTVASPKGDLEVMKVLSSARSVITPLSICSEAPRRWLASRDDWSTGFTIYYGNSLWNTIEYWNHPHFDEAEYVRSGSMRAIWLPSGALENTAFLESFVELLRRRAAIGNDRNGLRLISYDETLERMRDLTKQICLEFRWNLRPLEPVVRVKGELPSFQADRRTARFDIDAIVQHDQLAGQNAFLRLSLPDESLRGRQDSWIAELVIEDPQQERYFANKVPWWKLPQRSGVSDLFVRDARSRIGRNNLIKTEVTGKHVGLILTSPSRRNLFSRLVLPGNSGSPNNQLPLILSQRLPRDLEVLSSDKGKYVQGVLGLFDGLREAAFYFEHPYWRTLIDSLSMPSASEHTRNKVRDDLSRVDIDKGNREQILESLTDEVIDAASRVQRPLNYKNFDALFDSYWRFAKTLDHDERLYEVTQTAPESSPSGEKMSRKPPAEIFAICCLRLPHGGSYSKARRSSVAIVWFRCGTTWTNSEA